MTAPTGAATDADRALKARHRSMWAAGDYPGLAADLCILDRPWPADRDADALLERHVSWTVSGGQVVHEPSSVPAVP